MTDACLDGFGEGAAVCDSPETYFYYYAAHPSDAAHRVAGRRLHQDTLELDPIAPVPLPAGGALLLAGLAGLGALRARRPRG